MTGRCLAPSAPMKCRSNSSGWWKSTWTVDRVNSRHWLSST
jgi:hypothetical protein